MRERIRRQSCGVSSSEKEHGEGWFSQAPRDHDGLRGDAAAVLFRELGTPAVSGGEQAVWTGGDQLSEAAKGTCSSVRPQLSCS